MISAQDATYIYRAAMAVGRHYGAQADSIVVNALNTAGAQYDNVSMRRIAELSGYGQYLSQESRDTLFADLKDRQSSTPTQEQEQQMNKKVNEVRRILDDNKGDTEKVRNMLAEKNPNLGAEDLDELMSQAQSISGGFTLDTGGAKVETEEEKRIRITKEEKLRGEQEDLRSNIMKDYDRAQRLGGNDIPVLREIVDAYAMDLGVLPEIAMNSVLVLAALVTPR